jgi:peptidoglycan/LPS O-acetylase OafA/YrhL
MQVIEHTEEGETQGHGPLKHLPALDGLRGAAVVAVVIFHFLPRTGGFGLFRLASAGWIGVDVFFVLSGFLITSILLRQQRRPQAIRKFYVRRALRLFPLYYAMALIVAIGIAAGHLGWSRWQLGYLFYGANYVLILHSAAQTIGPFSLVHTWSLALEEQFYLLWPWLVLPSKISRQALLRICWVVIVVSPLLRFVWWQHGATQDILQMDLVTRMDSLLLGAVMALRGLPSARWSRVIIATSVLVVAWCTLRGHSLSLGQAPMNTLGLTATAAFSAGVLSLALKPGTWTHALCTLSPTRFLGRYSYGIYLWHVFLTSAWDRLADFLAGSLRHSPTPAGVIAVLTALCGSTALAYASYWAIERPFLRLKDRFEA